MDKATKEAIIKEYARHEGDTGSPEVQIALLTARINHLNDPREGSSFPPWSAADGRSAPQYA